MRRSRRTWRNLPSGSFPARGSKKRTSRRRGSERREPSTAKTASSCTATTFAGKMFRYAGRSGIVWACPSISPTTQTRRRWVKISAAREKIIRAWSLSRWERASAAVSSSTARSLKEISLRARRSATKSSAWAAKNAPAGEGAVLRLTLPRRRSSTRQSAPCKRIRKVFCGSFAQTI